MTFREAFSKPTRCTLVNLLDGESIECLFNPAELHEKIEVHYNRVGVPGLSHEVLQYQHTGNRTLPSIEFYLNRFFSESEEDTPDILNFHRFLLSLTVPPQGTEGVSNTAPPRLLFVWPEVITMEAVLTNVVFHYKQFGLDGQVLIYTAVVSFEEILDVRVTSEERRKS